MSTIKVIKKDALIPLQVGTGFLQKIQSVLLALVSERTEQELELYQKLATEQQEFPEPWMDNLHLLMVLISELDRSAEANGLTMEKDVDDAISESES